MKHQWMAYAIVALLAIGAGVAIAGLPDNVPVDDTIVAPTTTDAPEPTAPTTDVPETTDAPETTSAPDTTDAPETTRVPETTDAPETTDSVVPGIPERAELVVLVANGSGLSGAAALNATRLEEIGYVDVLMRNGTATVEFTTVYYADGFEAAADRLAEDLDLLPEFVAPFAEAPAVIDLPAGVELLAYIGIDRAR